MISILLIDDHPIVRQGLTAVLEEEPDFRIAGAFGSAEAALGRIAELRPAVALLDLELPGRSGIEAIPALLAAAPDLRILIFTAYDTDERVLGALQAGAKGYLLKGAPAVEIAQGIRIVAQGGSVLAPHIAAKLVAILSAPPAEPPPLSARERQVLKLIADGLSNKQIAHALAITERTVKFHVNSLFLKLDAENRAQVVALAAQRGLL